MHARHYRTLICCLLLALPALADARPADEPAGSRADVPALAPRTVEPGDELRVFLMTMGPGDKVWEMFGHNALWLHDPERGTDKAYNWGLFHFDQPGFIRRFIQGRMLYWMGGFDAYRTAAQYQLSNRSIWVQELNLTGPQKLALREFLDWNERPENAFYRYDYYRDNCSTRVRDALDLALGGQIRTQTEDRITPYTYRDHSRRLTAPDLPSYTGVLLGTGQPVDRPLSAWEEMFIPMAMQERLREITVRDTDGRSVPLVRSEETWFLADREPDRAEPPGFWPGFLAAGLLLGILLAGLGSAAPARRAAAIAFAGLAGAWLLVSGVLGLVLAGLWAFTDHAAAYRNENLFQFHPLLLALLGVLASFLFRGRGAGAARFLAAAIAVIAALGVLVKPLAFFFQVNGELVLLALPAHIGLAWGVHRAVAGPRDPAKATPEAHPARPTGARDPRGAMAGATKRPR